EPALSKGNNCLDAAKACNLNDTCKKFRSAYITPCTSSTSNEICNKRKCHKALRLFFDKVPPKHSYGMLFCSCRDIACTERRRQTIVPVCSYEDKEKPNCLNLQDSCKKNYICRSRLADFFTNCQPESRSISSCLKENYADCLLAYSGLIGTVMTPNYIDSNSLSVAPWCDCSNSGNDIEECLKFLNFFQDNTCLKNAIQAFGNGTDVTVWQPILPVQTTIATTTTASRFKNMGSESTNNEISTHNDLPACANLQAQKRKSNESVDTELCLNESGLEMGFCVERCRHNGGEEDTEDLTRMKGEGWHISVPGMLSNIHSRDEPVAGPSCARPLDDFKEYQALLRKVATNLGLESEEMVEQSDTLFNMLFTSTPALVTLLVHKGILKIVKALWQTLSTHSQEG
ncbi:GDNF family receptor alpha-1, partial [Chelonia mydas]